ncbi:MAG: hypothetical protein ACHREM_23990, partial [Polyangiales bacterium]
MTMNVKTSAARTSWTDDRRTLAAIWFLLATAGFLALHRRLGIIDSDAEGYVVGARALREGKGYVDTFGHPLNHWPPGYSWLLSFFREPLPVALVLNAVSFGVAVAGLGLLALEGGWTVSTASALASVIGFGLLRDLAVSAKPDILTYAAFFVAAVLYLRGGFLSRVAALVLWSVLIPVKMIAVVFAPGILIGECITLGVGPFLRARHRESIAGAVAWFVALGLLLRFNLATIGRLAADSHEVATLSALRGEVVRFVVGTTRIGLINWYGSIRAPSIFVPCMAVLLLGVAAFASLRPGAQGRQLRWMGLSTLGLAWLLEGVRTYYAGPRLMGYSMLLVVVGLPPIASRARLWHAYAVGSVFLAI